MKKSILILFLILILLPKDAVSYIPYGGQGEKRLQVLFTGDIHSRADYPTLSLVLAKERAEASHSSLPTVTLDAGDIAMGSAYHTLYTTAAFEYRVMEMMGYDAITAGNHDFDFGIAAFLQMMEKGSGGQDSSFVIANLSIKDSSLDKEFKRIAAPFRIIDRSGVRVAVIGLMGLNAFSVTTCADSLSIASPIEVADSLVKVVRKRYAPDFIIAISHGGTINGKGRGEDLLLADKVDGIDLIVSGHDHDLLHEPILVRDVPVVAAGSMGNFLGKIVISKGNGSSHPSLISYGLIPLRGAGSAEEIISFSTEAPADSASAAIVGRVNVFVDSARNAIAELFRNVHGVDFYDTVAFVNKRYELPEPEGKGFYFRGPDGIARPVSGERMNNLPLGLLVAESYRDAAVREYGGDFISVVPFGVIRCGLDSGYVTCEDIFNVLSLGRTPDGGFGYPLVTAFLSGKELYDICELNASVAGEMPDARLFFSGLEYEYNPCRIPFTRVTKVFHDGKKIEKGALYRVVTDIYTAELMGLLKSASFGVLSVTAKDEKGAAVSSLQSISFPVTQWMALAGYLEAAAGTGVPDKIQTGIAKAEPDRTVWLLYLLYLSALVFICSVIWRLLSGRR